MSRGAIKVSFMVLGSRRPTLYTTYHIISLVLDIIWLLGGHIGAADHHLLHIGGQIFRSKHPPWYVIAYNLKVSFRIHVRVMNWTWMLFLLGIGTHSGCFKIC